MKMTFHILWCCNSGAVGSCSTLMKIWLAKVKLIVSMDVHVECVYWALSKVLCCTNCPTFTYTRALIAAIHGCLYMYTLHYSAIILWDVSSEMLLSHTRWKSHSISHGAAALVVSGAALQQLPVGIWLVMVNLIVSMGVHLECVYQACCIDALTSVRQKIGHMVRGDWRTTSLALHPLL